MLMVINIALPHHAICLNGSKILVPGAPVLGLLSLRVGRSEGASYSRDTLYSDLHYYANDRTLPRTTSPSGLVGAPRSGLTLANR